MNHIPLYLDNCACPAQSYEPIYLLPPLGLGNSL
jgi:hypothetical protein